MMQRRLVWPLCKGDMETPEVFQIFICVIVRQKQTQHCKTIILQLNIF